MKIGFGLAGTGNMARQHAGEISRIKNARLLAVYSSSAERAEKFANKYGARAYTDYDKMLSNPDIQIIDIVTKNNLHAELGIRAAQRGKHVIVEKPIDVSLEKAEKLVSECQKAHVKLSVISQQRFDKAFKKVKNMIDNGKFGKIFSASISMGWRRNDNYYKTTSGWRASPTEAGGGVLIMQAIHLLDVLRWLCGPVSSVTSKMTIATHDIPIEDTAVGLIKFKNDIIATIACSTSVRCNIPDRLEIHGELGSVSIEKNRIIMWNFNKNPILSKVKSILLSLKPYARGSIKEQIEDVLDAIKEGREPAVTGSDGLETLRLINLLYSSDKLCKEERLN